MESTLVIAAGGRPFNFLILSHQQEADPRGYPAEWAWVSHGRRESVRNSSGPGVLLCLMLSCVLWLHKKAEGLSDSVCSSGNRLISSEIPASPKQMYMQVSSNCLASLWWHVSMTDHLGFAQVFDVQTNFLFSRSQCP